MADVHDNFDEGERWHGKGYGCVWKHPRPEKKGIEECDYLKNGYDVSAADRTGLYNKDHRRRAKAKKRGYLKDDNSVASTPLTGLVNARAASHPAGKDAAWKAKWRKLLSSPFGLLAKDAKAWQINHVFDGGSTKVRPWWSKGSARVPATNFKPRAHGGWHYQFPYKHTYHHLIEKSSFISIVLNGPASSDRVTPYRRKKIVLCKSFLHWNINNKDNIVLLPNEIPHADTVGLPAHCPWDTCDHPKYEDMIESKLLDVRNAIDGAVEDEDHEAIADAEDVLTQTQIDLLEEIKKLDGPL